MQVVIPDRAGPQRTVLHFETEFSDADLREFSRLNPGFVVEREGRKSVVMSPSGSGASYRSGELYYQLREWAKEVGGLVFESSAGFRLSDDSVLSPDVAWVSDDKTGRFTESEMEEFLPVCPELVIEVMSPSDRLSGTREKCLRWVREGARVAILVNPGERNVELFTPSGGSVASNFVEVEIPGFPELSLDLTRVWGDPRRSVRRS